MKSINNGYHLRYYFSFFWKKIKFLYIKMFFFLKGQFSIFLKKRKRCKTISFFKNHLTLLFSKLPMFLFFILVYHKFLFIFLRYSNNFILLLKIPACFFNNLFYYIVFFKLIIFNLEYTYIYINYLFLFNINTNIFFLKNFKKKTIQYSRSFNSFSKVIGHLYNLFFIIIKLPSLKLKIFFYLSSAFSSQLTFFKINKKLSFTLAGFSNKSGFLPTVRGVAKNPVDHPHGGRTKSIKYPRTPWGLTTKKNK